MSMPYASRLPNPEEAEASGVATAAAPPPPSSLALFLDPLMPLLEDTEVTEICINEPGIAFVERQTGWTREILAFASFDWCMSIAKLVANFTKQRVSAQEPLLSATLPGGERIQIVLPRRPPSRPFRSRSVVPPVHCGRSINLNRWACSSRHATTNQH